MYLTLEYTMVKGIITFNMKSAIFKGLSTCFLLVSFGALEIFAKPRKNLYDFKLVYEWKQLDYKFHSEEERSEAIRNGTFRIGHVPAIDAQYTYEEKTGRERIFVTSPRLIATGVPATIGVVTNETRVGNPIIDPYPSWSWQVNPEKCNEYRLISVFRSWADECGRLWIVDSGVVGKKLGCPPQILAFDLKTDKLLYKYEIPYAQHNNISWFITPIAEVESYENNCENTWLYVADCNGPSLMVYNLKENTSWVIKDRSFDVDPKYNVYTIAGDTFKYADGIITVALTSEWEGPERKLRYHAMSNTKESWVYLRDLKNRSNFKVPYGSSSLFHTYKHERDQQSATEAIDRHGNVYFSLLIDIKLLKWNPRTPYTPDNWEIINDDKKRMQFPSGLKILPYKGTQRQVLWVFSVAYQKFEADTFSKNESNFRLFISEAE